jgi:lipopolysaccharide transport system permease protein
MASFVRAPSQELVIESGQATRRYWKDLWRYRGLLYFLTWRDLVVRYKQTVIGVGWAIMPSLTTLIVLSVVFGKLAHLSSGNTPYPLFVLAATLPWQFFSNVLSQAGSSLVGNGNLISKVYFPRLVVPLSAVLVSAVDFCISAVLMLGLMAWYHYLPSWKIITLPFFFLLALFSAMGAALGLAALNVRYRDVRYVIPLMLQLGLYISPVGFSSGIVPPHWRLWYSLNPMVGVIDGFRWALLGEDVHLYLPGFFLSLGLIAVLCTIGLIYFRKVERTFADVI